MKHLKLTFLLTVLMSMVGAKAFAHDIEVKNADGVTIYYKWTNHYHNALAVSYRGSSYYMDSNEYSGHVVIPASVTYNGKEYSVTSIGYYAFYGCSGLTSVTIPNSVTSIGDQAFSNCSGLALIVVDSDNPVYDSRNHCNAIIETASNTLIEGCENTTIPNSVTSIGIYAFYGCTGLTAVTIPNSVTSIGSSAFRRCSGLTSIQVADGNPIYDSRNNCNAIIKTASNTLIKGCENTTIPNSVTSIGNYAFEGCSGLTSVTIPASVKSIGNYAFERCSGLTSVTIPASVKSIGSAAFSNCSGLTAVTIPNSVTSIGSYAFLGCSGLTDVTIPNSVTSIGYAAFSGCSGLTAVAIPNSVTSTGERAFSNCSGLTDVTIPNSVTSIGNWAFSNCSGLTSITIPNSVTYIGVNAFEGCTGLTAVAIPNSVTTIGSDVFRRCSGLTAVTIGNSVTSIGNYAFYECSSLTSIQVADGNPIYDSRNNCNAIIETESNTLIFGCKNTTIPNSVMSIGSKAFSGCSGLTAVTIPNSVTSIGDQAFSNCSGLTAITIPNSVTSIGSDAFWNCSGLTAITIPNSVTSIGNWAFYGCSSLTSVTVWRETPVSIHFDAFSNRANATLYVPAGCKSAYEAADYWKEFREIIEMNGPYVVGDINGDNVVDVSDYTGIANFIHGNPPAGFNEKAADVDKNGTVDVSDYTGIANIIHTGSIYGNSSNSARATGNQPTADWDAKDNVIFIAPFTATAGTKTAISFEMKNTAAIRGFQFDLYLPEGMTVVKSAKGKIQGKLSEGRLPDEDEHDLTFSQQPDGAIRFLCSSQYDETFTGTSGELATLQVEIASNMANGEHAIQLKNMKLTETDISKYYTSDLIESTVTIEGGATTGIIAIDNDQLNNANEAGAWYTIDGRRLTSRPAKAGLYIKNGKKVVIE